MGGGLRVKKSLRDGDDGEIGEGDGMCLTAYVNGWVLGGCLICEHLVT